MAKTFSIAGTITVTEVAANMPPVFSTQPPSNVSFLVGTPASIPYGNVSDPDNDPLTVALEPIVQGFTVSLNGNQIMLNWDGNGVAGNYSVQVSADDGK